MMHNIKMQRTETNVVLLRPRSLSAADLGVRPAEESMFSKYSNNFILLIRAAEVPAGAGGLDHREASGHLQR